MAMKDFKGKEVLDTLVDLPIAVPPLVAGLALLVLLGGRSPLGGMLSHHGIEIIFSKKGIIIAQLFVSSPFLLCIHPEKITLKKETDPVDAVNGKLNRIKGRIVNRTHNGHGIKITVDIGGMMLQAVVPKHPFDFKLHEHVWVCFPLDALHPLCGKRCRSPEALRKCLQ